MDSWAFIAVLLVIFEAVLAITYLLERALKDD